jgi:hypothetical protein
MKRASAVLVLLSLFGAREAFAYCRTRTVETKADYDATTEGCFQAGDPLFWRNSCIGYSIQQEGTKQIAYNIVADLISTAFTRWTGAACPVDANGRSRPSIDVRDLGPVECGDIKFVSGAANQNVIVFRDDTWTYAETVLGLTKVQYLPSTGEISGADMEINMVHMPPFRTEDPVGDGEYDFLSVVTHEAGHFLGIAHSDTKSATMYAFLSRGQAFTRRLAADDIEAVCEVYRPNGDRSVLKEKVTAAPQCDPTPRGGYASECQEKPGRCSFAPSSSPSTWCFVLGAAALLAARRVTADRRRCRSGPRGACRSFGRRA